jgi:hypothetical protein
MSDRDEEVKRHTAELVRLTVAAGRGPDPLPEDELATLGAMIATERLLLIEAVSGLLQEDDPEAATRPGVAEFDAGFCYGLAFARAIDDARLAIEGTRRGRLLKLVRNDGTYTG